MGIRRFGESCIPAPKPTAPPVTIATLPASLPLGNVVTGVVSDVVGALLEPAWVAIAVLSGYS